jgi:hypothetical protein
VLEWRRKTTKQIKGIGNFLIELWNSEEAMLEGTVGEGLCSEAILISSQVPQGEHGTLEKLQSPLVGLADLKVSANNFRSFFQPQQCIKNIVFLYRTRIGQSTSLTVMWSMR